VAKKNMLPVIQKGCRRKALGTDVISKAMYLMALDDDEDESVTASSAAAA